LACLWCPQSMRGEGLCVRVVVEVVVTPTEYMQVCLVFFFFFFFSFLYSGSIVALQSQDQSQFANLTLTQLRRGQSTLRARNWPGSSRSSTSSGRAIRFPWPWSGDWQPLAPARRITSSDVSRTPVDNLARAGPCAGLPQLCAPSTRSPQPLLLGWKRPEN